MQIDKLIDAGYPLWFVFFMVLVSLFSMMSKHFGTLNQWWVGRQSREVSRTMSLADQIDDAVTKGIAIKMAPYEEQLKQSIKEVERLRKDVEKARVEISYRDEYSLEQARYIRSVKEWHVQEGYEIPTPPGPGPDMFTVWLEKKLQEDKKKGIRYDTCVTDSIRQDLRDS